MGLFRVHGRAKKTKPNQNRAEYPKIELRSRKKIAHRLCLQKEIADEKEYRIHDKGIKYNGRVNHLRCILP